VAVVVDRTEAETDPVSEEVAATASEETDLTTIRMIIITTEEAISVVRI
jgi:hypothetical protein